jgi:hypothetical protein
MPPREVALGSPTGLFSIISHFIPYRGLAQINEELLYHSADTQ